MWETFTDTIDIGNANETSICDKDGGACLNFTLKYTPLDGMKSIRESVQWVGCLSYMQQPLACSLAFHKVHWVPPGVIPKRRAKSVHNLITTGCGPNNVPFPKGDTACMLLPSSLLSGAGLPTNCPVKLPPPEASSPVMLGLATWFVLKM